MFVQVERRLRAITCLLFDITGSRVLDNGCCSTRIFITKAKKADLFSPLIELHKLIECEALLHTVYGRVDWNIASSSGRIESQLKS